MKKIAILSAQFSPEITDGLKSGAVQTLLENNYTSDQIDHFEAPGSFELPLLSKKLAQTGQYSGVICLGSVIKGETAHFEFISLATSMGLLQASVETEVPISFGVLTVYHRNQAELRSKPGPHNKGREAALAVLESLKTLEKIRGLA